MPSSSAPAAIKNCDVLVVGGGMAGLVAGCRAAQLGAKVLLIDKGSFVMGDGNTLMTTGAFFTAGVPPKSPPDGLYNAVMSEQTANPDLARAWADNVQRTVEWLASAGVQVEGSGGGGQGMRLEPSNSTNVMGPVFRMGVGVSLTVKLRGFLQSHGGVTASRLRATKLRTSEGKAVVGAEAEETTTGNRVTIRSRATILACGGFQANRELLRKYVGSHADQCKLRGSAAATGDGLRMAAEVGAKLVNMQYFYGHLLSLKALEDDRFWPYPRLDTLVADGVVVNRAGRRFSDEGRTDIPVSNEISRWDDPTSACLVFDEAAWERSKGDPSSPFFIGVAPNPWLLEHDAYVYTAGTIDELANKLGVDRKNLQKTVEEFNAGAKGSLEGLEVPRSNRPKPMQPPFYGLKVVPGITFTMGGPLINGKGSVLDKDERPIPGLFAAGDTIGGLMGGKGGGYTGGVSQATVTGLLAGESAREYSSRVLSLG